MKFLIKGYIHGLGEVFRVCEADSEGEAVSGLSKIDLSEGGFVRFSVEEVTSFPDHVNISCPKCDHRFADPGKVIDLD